MQADLWSWPVRGEFNGEWLKEWEGELHTGPRVHILGFPRPMLATFLPHTQGPKVFKLLSLINKHIMAKIKKNKPKNHICPSQVLQKTQNDQNQLLAHFYILNPQILLNSRCSG